MLTLDIYIQKSWSQTLRLKVFAFPDLENLRGQIVKNRGYLTSHPLCFWHS